MKIGNFLYLFTIFAFAGAGNYLIWYERKKLLKKHWKFITAFVLLATPFAAWEAIAFRWNVYLYHPEHVFNKHILGAEVETYLFMALITAAAASATVIYLQEEARGQLKIRHRARRHKRRSSKLRRLYPAAAATRR